MKKLVLDEEERDVVESSETGEWIPGKNPQNEKMKLRKFAKEYFAKR